MLYSTQDCTPVVIESVDYEGRGVTRIDGKVVFIEGGITGEVVACESFRHKKNFEIAALTRVYRESNLRAEPLCPHFNECGGCSLQHIDVTGQVAIKQRVLEDTLRHIGKVSAEIMLPAITGPSWGYRHRARLSVHYLPEQGGAIIGFRQKKSSYVADLKTCAILPSSISQLLLPLRQLINRLSIPNRIPQIELAVGERGKVEDISRKVVGKNLNILVLRILRPLTSQDERLLKEFSVQHNIFWYIQPRGPESAYPLCALPEKLVYSLDEFSVKIHFEPTDFTQVNHQMNEVLVKQAIQLLAPQPTERIADFFCGLGNFTLPIARSGAYTYGVEGNSYLVERARQNARVNGLEEKTKFWVQNLFEATTEHGQSWGKFDKLLLDPPREGALAVVKALPDKGMERVVYVSCNPATLARDAAILVHTKGYRLRKVGIVNMFPHTTHVESIACFDRAS